MIKSITVTNHLNESLKMILTRPAESGFVILSTTGLGPPKATINTSELATADGSLYNSARASSRNVVLSLRFLGKPTIEKTRHKSYKYFPIKQMVKLAIETDVRTTEILGYVESNEPDIFSKEEGCQISIICPDPYFYSASDQLTIFSGAEPLFEFPFSNESLSEDLLEVSRLRVDEIQTVVYEGDTDVGVTIHIHAIGSARNITIYNATTRESMVINSDKLIVLMGSDIQNRDDIIISTVRNNKYIYLLREGVYTNILSCLERDMDWFRLSKGDNVFYYTAEEGMTNLQFKVVNRVAYQGV